MYVLTRPYDFWISLHKSQVSRYSQPILKLDHAFFHSHHHWPLCPHPRDPRPSCQTSESIPLLRPLPHFFPLGRTAATPQHRLSPNGHPRLRYLNPLQPLCCLLSPSRYHRQWSPSMVHFSSPSCTILRYRSRRQSPVYRARDHLVGGSCGLDNAAWRSWNWCRWDGWNGE